MSAPSDLKAQVSADVRKRAEELIRGRVADLHRPLPQEIEQLLYELEVHRIELEIQNEELRQAQIELARARDRYADLYQFAPAGYLSLDAHRVICEANLTAAAMFQVERHDLLGERLEHFVAPDDQDPCYHSLRAVLTSASRETCEARFRRADGSSFVAQVETVPIEQEEGGPTGCRVTLSDVTNRRLAEEALRESEEQLRLAQAAGGVGTFDWDLATQAARCSQEYFRVVNRPWRTGGQLTLAEWQSWVHPDDRQRVMAALQAALDGKGQAFGEYRMVGEDGKTRWILYQGQTTRDAHGRAVRMLGTALDITERKRAEEALRRANEDWEETFNTVPDLVAILDRERRVVRANRAMAERLNSTPEQCIGRHCYEIVHGASHPAKSCLHGQTCRDGREHTTELEEPRLGGHFLVTTSPRFDEQGRVIGTVHVARDVTRLKRTEKALQRLNAELEGRVAEQTAEVRKTYEVAKAERQRLYDLLETLPVYVVLLSTDYHVPFANRFFRERFGESHGRCCFEYLFERKEPCENCEAYKVLSTGAPHRWAWAGPDGRYYDVYDFPFVEADGSTLILEVGVDVTDHTKAQLALEASEARYRSFVTASTQIVWTTDAQGLVAGDLPSWRAFTGQSLAQIQGWGWADALHPDDRQHTAALWSNAVATRSLYADEYRVRRHNGEYRWLSVHGVPVLADGVIREWVGACTDITERKRAEEESLRMKEELAHVDRVARMGELAASLAHELSQPLAAILSNAQAARRFLASAAPDLDMFREVLDDIIRDDKRAGSVIHRLRLMLQRRRQERETFDVNDAIGEVVQLLHSETIGRNVALSMDLAPRLPAVRAGRVEVQQVMVNLLLNALDALKDVPPDRREILIRTRSAEDAVVVAVQDWGCGIASPDVNSVFEPFFTTKPAGLGMGLAICRRVIQAHGGRIWAADNKEVGATISFSLPSTPARLEPSDG